MAYWGGFLAVALMMHIAFFLALRWKRNDLADVIWGPGFVVLGAGAWVSEFLQGNFYWTWRMILAFSFLCIWAFRLFFHLGLRTWRKETEDWRYQEMRERWKEKWKWNTYLWVFLFQGALMFLVGLPVVEIFRARPESFNFSFYLGVLLWLIGFLMETISDSQLKAFKSRPENKGRIMSQGLWSWSRHPNYFGDSLQWWGLFWLISTGLGNVFALIGPVLMTFLLLKVSGVPLLEKQMESRPGWDEYKRRTSLFFPWPPKEP
jgi:steroid 5-alpha reductase family enzyme